MTAIRFVAAICLSTLLASCAAPAVYAPAQSPNATGYSHSVIEENRYRVTYRGGDRDTAYDYALLRAAELTLAGGYDWFRVVNASGEEQSGYGSGPRVSVGGGLGTGGGRTRGGVGIGIGFPLGGSSGAAEQSLEIVMGRGAKPNDPNAYDAASVSQTIRARMTNGG